MAHNDFRENTVEQGFPPQRNLHRAADAAGSLAGPPSREVLVMALPLPSALPPRAAALAALLLLILAGLLAGAPSASAAGPGVDARERNVVERINAVRRAHGLRPLALRRSVSVIADRHARRQAQRRVLTHQFAGGPSVAQRLRSAGRRSGEVVYFAGGGARSATIVRAWMDSPGHRAVLLSRGFSGAGVAIRRGGGGLYATVDVVGR